MKFVTELELRNAYRSEPFDTYVLLPGTRLTPGARQFLIDFKISWNDGFGKQRVASIDEGNAVSVTTASPAAPEIKIGCPCSQGIAEITDDLEDDMVQSALMLKRLASDLYAVDSKTACAVHALGTQLLNIDPAQSGASTYEDFPPKERYRRDWIEVAPGSLHAAWYVAAQDIDVQLVACARRWRRKFLREHHKATGNAGMIYDWLMVVHELRVCLEACVSCLMNQGGACDA